MGTEKYKLSFDVLLVRMSRLVQEISQLLCTCRSSQVSILNFDDNFRCIGEWVLAFMVIINVIEGRGRDWKECCFYIVV